ncbi:hypothetical protein BDY21DRAFT_84555 [Lineolata rhizophorae]|uniref:Uncharacterized protein n=1 Tax=Lineolata rhizophorae TaxID=578093 RepID=A0A6A6PC93_9PEZI|nr:hypothetical protein BDY21DRAFT_84555 [Lineolata rhizophorae]
MDLNLYQTPRCRSPGWLWIAKSVPHAAAAWCRVTAWTLAHGRGSAMPRLQGVNAYVTATTRDQQPSGCHILNLHGNSSSNAVERPKPTVLSAALRVRCAVLAAIAIPSRSWMSTGMPQASRAGGRQLPTYLLGASCKHWTRVTDSGEGRPQMRSDVQEGAHVVMSTGRADERGHAKPRLRLASWWRDRGETAASPTRRP